MPKLKLKLKPRMFVVGPKGLEHRYAGKHAAVNPIRWLKWARFETFDGGGRCVWMYRWTLLNFRGWSLFLHHWLHDDWTVHHHDHSRAMVSIGLKGRYTEHLFDGTVKTWSAPWVRYFPAEHRHYITLDSATAWTLVIGCPSNRHKTGYWVEGEYVGSSTYLRSQYADAQKRC